MGWPTHPCRNERHVSPCAWRKQVKAARHASRARNPELNKAGWGVPHLEFKPDARRDVRGQVVLLEDIVLRKGRGTQVARHGQRG